MTRQQVQSFTNYVAIANGEMVRLAENIAHPDNQLLLIQHAITLRLEATRFVDAQQSRRIFPDPFDVDDDSL